MLKLLTLSILAIALTGCAAHRQPRAKCSGPLERINVTPPENVTAPAEAAAEPPEGAP
jgi:hypothetical protein